MKLVRLISALIWFLFARQMTAKTVLGARTLVAVLGFQEFMNRVDADRIKRLPPDTFEKYLPYAMALGVLLHREVVARVEAREAISPAPAV